MNKALSVKFRVICGLRQISKRGIQGEDLYRFFLKRTFTRTK